MYLEKRVGKEPWKDRDDISDELRQTKKKLRKMKREFEEKQNLQSNNLTA